MDLKRQTEWLNSAEGLVKAIIAILGAPSALWLAVSNALQPIATAVKLPLEVAQAFSAMITAALVLMVVRSYLCYIKFSRIEKPDAFILRPIDANSLIGRQDDILNWVDRVRKNRLSILDGESGCGKSALVSAGIIPTLQAEKLLLPVLVRDWGDDWERGPLAEALKNLHAAMTVSDREKIGWTGSPDLAAETTGLLNELNTRLHACHFELKRTPLIIADQFDDYLGRHPGKFVDAEGAWLQPDVLKQYNMFWAMVAQMLSNERLYLLVVTRSDMAAGTTCLRFTTNAAISSKTLSRVQMKYLYPLLEGIAPDNATPPIVSHPENGWHDLRERLETDLKRQSAILMQQVRTLLLGLQSLPTLTPRAYTRAGGLRGMEDLYIRHALEQAAEAAEPSVHTKEYAKLARAVLGKMVSKGGPNTPPKAKRAILEDLCADASHKDVILKILASLQASEVIRPAEDGQQQAWQLDHDYLARAVLMEANQAERLQELLQDWNERYQKVGDAWRARWQALLPTHLQIRLHWQHWRHNLNWTNQQEYVRLSLIRPVIQGLILTFTVLIIPVVYYDYQLTQKANELVNQFGRSRERQAIIEIWKSDDSLKRRVMNVIQSSKDKFEGDSSQYWPWAQVGLDDEYTLEVAAVLRTQLENDMEASDVENLQDTYANIIKKLSAGELNSEVIVLRKKIKYITDNNIAERFVIIYGDAVTKLSSQIEINAESIALHDDIKNEKNNAVVDRLQRMYNSVTAKSVNQSKIASPIDWEINKNTISTDQESTFNSFVAKLDDQEKIYSAVVVLREKISSESSRSISSQLQKYYDRIIAKLSNQDQIRAEAVALRTRLENENNKIIFNGLRKAYESAIKNLHDQGQISSEIISLREQLGRTSKLPFGFRSLLKRFYVSVAAKLSDQDQILTETIALHRLLDDPDTRDIADSLASAYASVAPKLSDQDKIKSEVAALRARLELGKDMDGSVAPSLAKAYASVAAKLSDLAEVEQAAQFLQTRLLVVGDPEIVKTYAESMALVTQSLLAAMPNSPSRRSWIIRVIALSSHPYLEERGEFLDALEPVTQCIFSDESDPISAAVRWATKTYGISVKDMRPSKVFQM